MFYSTVTTKITKYQFLLSHSLSVGRRNILGIKKINLWLTAPKGAGQLDFCNWPADGITTVNVISITLRKV